MPYWVTIARATLVAFSMSLPAPVVGSWKMRLLRGPAAEHVGERKSSICERVWEYLSSSGSTIV